MQIVCLCMWGLTLCVFLRQIQHQFLGFLTNLIYSEGPSRVCVCHFYICMHRAKLLQQHPEKPETTVTCIIKEEIFFFFASGPFVPQVKVSKTHISVCQHAANSYSHTQNAPLQLKHLTQLTYNNTNSRQNYNMDFYCCLNIFYSFV